MEREKFTARDGKELSLAVWETENAKGIVQIIHGMSEHIERYDAFANFLNGKGYIVAGHDLRAHGMTDPDRLGLAEKGKDLFEDTVEDAAEITAALSLRYGLPVVLVGHSYGSFLSQEYLLKHSELIKGCILSGSALYGTGTVGFGKFVAKLKNPDKPGKFFAGITFNSYDKKVKEGLNGWLSKNKESNEKYNADPMCGFTCSNGFYRYFFTHLKNLARVPFDTVPKDFPLMIAYGSEDDVGERGKLIKSLREKYEKYGISPVMKEYAGDRHEILNELDRDTVMADMGDFIDSLI